MNPLRCAGRYVPAWARQEATKKGSHHSRKMPTEDKGSAESCVLGLVFVEAPESSQNLVSLASVCIF